jgi:hypothetical protein
MITRSTTAALAALTLLGVLAATALGGPAAPLPAKKVTNEGVGQVKLGKTHMQLRQQGLVGRLRAGCELGGGNTRSARLLAPLRGQVDYSLTNPRIAKSILIRRGATAKGVGRGDTIPEIKAKFPHARVNKDTEEVFGLWLVTVPKRDGGKFQFAVDADTERVTVMGVPIIAFCE